MSSSSRSGDQLGEALRVLSEHRASGALSDEQLLARHPDLRELLEALLEDSATPEPQAVRPGALVGDFELVERIGAGGMGEVWKARQRSLQRDVALKLLIGQRFASAQALERFRREALAGARLRHQAIVGVHAVGEAQGVHFIAQELVEGGRTLAHELRELRELPHPPAEHWRRTAERFALLADALEAAHKAGILHRDIKPSNILLERSGAPKLADFGLARVEGELELSRTGDMWGSPFYMSPEQAAAQRVELDGRSDVFSLGATLYETLALVKPFDGDTVTQVLTKILADDPVDPRQHRSLCPRELALICLKMLEKEPARRYASMSEAAADLRRFLAHEPIHARPASALQRAVKWTRRNPAASSSAGIGTVALIVVSALLFEQARTAHALERSNVDLEAQTARAARGEEAAQESAALAERSAADATRKASDVLALSTQKDLDDLVNAAARLWPATPDKVREYEAWLQRADELLNGRPANASLGLKRRPSLDEHKATLAELRRGARPLTEEQARLDRESHPQFAELERARVELLWRSRMLGLEPWPDEQQIEAELAQEALPSDAQQLNGIAWDMLNPPAPRFGNEVRARVLARRALAAADDTLRAAVRDTLAWACARSGQLDEALEQMQLALAEPGGEQLRKGADELERFVENSRDTHFSTRRAQRDDLAAAVLALEHAVGQRRTFEFDDSESAWWDRQLSQLIRSLEAFGDPRNGLASDALAAPFGWGVRRRLEFARTIEERSVTGPDVSAAWREAADAIRGAAHYGGLTLEPQLGLVPLGPDPRTGLWEFAHLATGEPPQRGADGVLELSESTGIVLVLIPGGEFWMGAQAQDPNARNYDPRAETGEGPVHEVELSPYFVSKYEMTQAQWQRLAGVNPSYYKPSRGFGITLEHPVESVSWSQCVELLERADLVLPSEAQWEHAARGGTSTAWWTGDERDNLRGAANLADQTAKRLGAPWPAIEDWPEFEDGSGLHCRVGAHAPNGFGLHNVAGNVWEWCRDGYDTYFYTRPATLDPCAPWANASHRIVRGGAFNDRASNARSSYRDVNPFENSNVSMGVRPARALRRAEPGASDSR
jgi:formylglycine-generating enzyme required for sulfatase activity